MSDTGTTGGAAPSQGNNQDQGSGNRPPLMILHQYTKDLSFENPSTPAHILRPDQQMKIDAKVDVTANHLGERNFEVLLYVEFKSTVEDRTIYLGELIYGAIVQIGNLRQEDLQPALLIEIPRMLFPFARSIVSTATRDGGFPPLLLSPYDFVDHYRRKLAQSPSAENAGGDASGDAAAAEGSAASSPEDSTEKS